MTRFLTTPCGALAIAMLLILAAGTMGCGRQPKRLEVFPVKGKILFGGKAAAGATVVLHPIGNPALPRPVGTVQKDGTFTVRTYETDDGAPAGKYKLTVELVKFVQKGDDFEPGKNLLPAKYADAAKSNLLIEVATKPNEVPPITLRR